MIEYLIKHLANLDHYFDPMLDSGTFFRRLFILCFAIGSAVAAIVAGCGLSLTWQIIIFAVSALGLPRAACAIQGSCTSPARSA